MPHVEFRRQTITIPSGTGRRTFTSTANFGSNVLRAGVALNGFDLDFSPSGTTGQVDRHINVLEVVTNLGATGAANTITFSVTCQYADVNFDDPYQGYISVLAIAEVV
jgi:hypothetical protein